MKLTEWLKYGIYKKLWSLIGGRPWTYISRDIYHRFEYIWLVSLFVGGFALGHCKMVSWGWFLCLMIAYTIGYIHGHFFWGRDYVPGQEGD